MDFGIFTMVPTWVQLHPMWHFMSISIFLKGNFKKKYADGSLPSIEFLPQHKNKIE
jgi:hypothetical protein